MNQKKPDRLEQKRPLFFTIGLCASLLIIHALFQIKSYHKTPELKTYAVADDFDNVVIPVTRPKQPEPPKTVEVVKTVQKNIIPNLFIEVPDNWKMEDDTDSLFVFDDVTFETGEEPVLEIIIDALDKKPVFPGCEDLLTEDERFACFQQKMIAFVQSNFKPCQPGYRRTAQKIYVRFTIDENGRSKNPQLVRGDDVCNTQEALSLVTKLPEMKPGMYRDKRVKTSFVLPINIK